MDPLTASLLLGSTAISSGGSLLGGMASNAATANQQSQANYVNSQEFLNSAAQQSTEFNAAQQFNSQQAGVSRDWVGSQAQASRDFNASQAQINRDYQTYMSNTAYQRAVSGMKAAGLNPILSAGTGGASTPMGSMASSGIPSGATASSPGSPGLPGGNTAGAAAQRDVFSPAIASAMSAANAFADVNLKLKQADGSLSPIHVGPTGISGTPEGIKQGIVTVSRDAPAAIKSGIDRINDAGKPISDTLNDVNSSVQDLGHYLHGKLVDLLDLVPANPGAEAKKPTTPDVPSSAKAAVSRDAQPDFPRSMLGGQPWVPSGAPVQSVNPM